MNLKTDQVHIAAGLPSTRFLAAARRRFATNFFDTTDGRHIEGFIVREGGTEVVIRDLAGIETTLGKDQIKSRVVRKGSIKPPGLPDTLTLHELASLLAYLGSTTGK